MGRGSAEPSIQLDLFSSQKSTHIPAVPTGKKIELTKLLTGSYDSKNQGTVISARNEFPLLIHSFHNRLQGAHIMQENEGHAIYLKGDLGKNRSAKPGDAELIGDINENSKHRVQSKQHTVLKCFTH